MYVLIIVLAMAIRGLGIGDWGLGLIQNKQSASLETFILIYKKIILNIQKLSNQYI